VLGAVRNEFGKFGEVLARAQKKLTEAANTIEEARGKTTTIARRLKDVEALPDPDAPVVASRELFDIDDPRDAK
jgi:DNA recombination protein RmuC